MPFNQNSIDEILHLLKDAIRPYGYTDFLVSDPEDYLTVLSPKTSTCGNLDFISIDPKVLSEFRKGGDTSTCHEVDLGYETIQGKKVKALSLTAYSPAFGILTGYEVPVAIGDDNNVDDPVGVCLTVTDVVRIGHGDEENQEYVKNPQLLDLGYNHLMPLVNTMTFQKLVDMNHNVIDPTLPKGLTAKDSGLEPKLMGIFYTANVSLLAQYPTSSVPSLARLLDSLSNCFTKDLDCLAESFIILEVIPGCRINMAIASYNPTLDTYLIDNVTMANHIQLPANVGAAPDKILTGSDSSNLYREDVLSNIQTSIQQLMEEEQAARSTPKDIIELDGVVQFPTRKPS